MVSVIVPIYNVEKYLKNCIESVLNQSYRDLEIILVDDGSPDCCGEICEHYEQLDNRVKAIHKKNAGLGFARNSGLEIATGEFILFVDSDDWLEENAIETWLKNQEEYQADMVMCNYNKCDDTGNILYKYRLVKEKKVLSTSSAVENEIFWPMIAQPSTVRDDYTINMCVWTNLYRRKIIEDNSIRFYSERECLSEDICFNLKYLLNCNSVVMIPDSLYCYRFNPNSLTCTYKGNEHLKAINLLERISTICGKAKNKEMQEYRLERFFITKLRELMFRVVGSKCRIKDKYGICASILNDTKVKEILVKYPIETYALKYRVPAILMKKRLSLLIIVLFTIMGKRRKH